MGCNNLGSQKEIQRINLSFFVFFEGWGNHFSPPPSKKFRNGIKKCYIKKDMVRICPFYFSMNDMSNGVLFIYSKIKKDQKGQKGPKKGQKGPKMSFFIKTI